jgi:DNA-binding MarR family transcriptional regulator/N-acetylglutamate synthase-like GNAT family acetyltransferase
MTLIDEVRSFNRFYTREIGLLNRSLPATDLSLPEARVLYELAHAPEGGLTAAEIGRTLRMDKAHLSRIVARFVTRGLAVSRVSPDHRKHRPLTLTDAGRKVFAAAEAGARAQVDALLEPVDAGGRNRLVEAMRDIRVTLRDREAEDGELTLRPLRPGDVGWIIHRQAVLYTQEYGWDWTYEGLASRILGAFVAEFDPAREDGWVAERGGAIVGSIFLMKSDDPAVAKLRLLYVEPSARGAGVGRRLVGTCIARARELGYRELTLWTNDILVAARRIYQAAGFRLVSEAPHHSFGHDLVGQTWTLELA